MTAIALAIQKFCAIIAYKDDAADTTWTGIGRGEDIIGEQEDLRRGHHQQAAYVQDRRLGMENHHRDGGSGCTYTVTAIRGVEI